MSFSGFLSNYYWYLVTDRSDSGAKGLLAKDVFFVQTAPESLIQPIQKRIHPANLFVFVKGKSSKILWMVQKSQTTTMGCIKTCVSNGINRIKYQPQLVSLPDFSHQSKVGHDSAAKLRPFTINWTTSSRSTWFPSPVRSKISRLSEISE